ncbi:MAG: OmpA family protein [Magnetococcales bacterium]|nr:OmpA family protein [Magnetococcales bacterium]
MRWLLVIGMLMGAAMGQAASLPDFVTLPKSFKVDPGSVRAEEFGEAEMPLPDREEAHVVQGRFWHADALLEGVAEDAAFAVVWEKIKPVLLKGGWQVVHEFKSDPLHITLRNQQGGRDAWGHLWVMGAGDLRLDVVDAAAKQTRKLVLKKPGTKPEKISANHGDFPYLSPLPDSKQVESSFRAEPMRVQLEEEAEEQVVGMGVYNKRYESAAGGLSNLQFATLYREALESAGWRVVRVGQGLNKANAEILGHYDKDGRDIWAYLHGGGGEYSMDVADVGQDNLAEQLKKECRVPLYGVLFDFNKATLKSESNGVLLRARDAVKANANLAIEVQGHTDHVGNDDYNQKLSEARARTVMQWLIDHEIPANRLQAKGYGRTQPIASNDTDEGRAQNRRVALACQGKTKSP